MSRATTCDISLPATAGIVIDIIETEDVLGADVLGEFVCTIPSVMDGAGNLVTPAQPSGDEVSAGYRSAYCSRH